MKALAIKSSLFSCLKTYNKKTFMSDLMAGIIVGIVALPLAIAFGIASGVTLKRYHHRHCSRSHHLHLRWKQSADWWSYGSIHRYHLWHYPEIWHGRFDDSDTNGWSVPGSLRTSPSWNHHQVHPLPYRCGIYQWYRRNHLHDPDQGSLWIDVDFKSF